jgi:hypothetical protein
MVVENPPQKRVMLANEFGNPLHRHGRRHQHEVGFKQQRKAATFSGPGNINHSYAAFFAPDARYTSI